MNQTGQFLPDNRLSAINKASSRTSPPPGPGPEPDLLFAHDAVDLTVLRQRAYNHRWAVHPDHVIPLTAADTDFPVCEDIIEVVKKHLDSGYTPYGPPEGLPELRNVAAETLRARHNIPCDPESLFPTDGAASAVFLATRFVIGSEGDEAIIPDPVDFLLDRAVKAAGGVVRRWQIPDGRFDVAELETLVTPRTRLVSLSNPHNPLGRVMRRDELERIAEVALRHDLWILSDEVWSDIVYAPHRHVSIASLGPEIAARTFTVFGFSKSYGLAGMRLGLLATPNASLRSRVLHLAHADDTAYGVSTLSQVAGAAAYQFGDPWLGRFVSHLRRQRDYAVQRLNAMNGVSCVMPEGTFVVFPHISGVGIDQDEVAARLVQRHGLAVIPGSPGFFGPGAASHIRLSFATSRTILENGLSRLAKGMDEMRQSCPATRTSQG